MYASLHVCTYSTVCTVCMSVQYMCTYVCRYVCWAISSLLYSEDAKLQSCEVTGAYKRISDKRFVYSIIVSPSMSVFAYTYKYI